MATLTKPITVYPAVRILDDDRITIDPEVCHGKPCIRGTRVLVYVILDALAAGHTPAEIAADYPPVTVADVDAALRFAAALTERIGGNGH